MALVDASCLLGFPPEQRQQQLYEALYVYAGDDTLVDPVCFLSLDRQAQFQAILATVGGETGCVITEGDMWSAFYRALYDANPGILTLDPNCFSGDPQTASQELYRAFYALAGDDTLTDPDCFLGLSQGKRHVALFGAVSAVAGGGAAPQLFADSVDGDDGNTGTSQAEAFATIAALQTAMAADPTKLRVGLVRGSYWREQLTITATGARVTAVGTGAAPVLDGSELVGSGDWIKTGGRTNVYETPITTAGNVKTSVHCWEGDNFLTLVGSVADCDATPGSAYVPNLTSASTTLYIHPTGSTSPIVNGRTYEYSSRDFGLHMNGANAVVRGIRTRRSCHQDGSLVAEGGALLVDCRAEDGSRHNCLVGGNSIVRNCAFVGGRASFGENSSNGIVCFEADLTGKTLRLEDCLFDGNGSPDFVAWLAHDSYPAHLMASITILRPTLTDCRGWGSAPGVTVTISDPVCENCFDGFGPTAGSTVLIENGTGSIRRYIYADASGFTLTSRNNSFECPLLELGFYRSDTNDAGASANVWNIENDTVTLTGSVGSSADFLLINRGNVNVTGASFGPNLVNKAQHVYNFGSNGGSVTYTGSENHFPYGPEFASGGSEYASLAEWQAASGQDATSDLFGGGAPVVAFADNFNRANENLEASANWTRVDGVAGMGQVKGNQFAIVAPATRTGYTAPDINSVDMWVRGTVVNTSGGWYRGTPLCVRVVNGDNRVGLGWGPTFVIAYRVSDGNESQINLSNMTINAGDVLALAVRGSDYQMYVNGARVGTNFTTFSIPTLDSSTKAGIVIDGTASDPCMDNFECGPVA